MDGAHGWPYFKGACMAELHCIHVYTLTWIHTQMCNFDMPVPTVTNVVNIGLPWSKFDCGDWKLSAISRPFWNGWQSVHSHKTE